MNTYPTLSREPAFGVRVPNFLASGLLVAAACAAYALQPMHAAELGPVHAGDAFSFTGLQFILAAAMLYILLLGVYYAGERVPGVSKSVVFFRVTFALLRSPAGFLSRRWSREERLAVLATLLKAFFGPIMAVSLMRFMAGWIGNGAAIFSAETAHAGFADVFDQHGFWFAMQIILFVDVLLFTFGYLVELPRLNNQIRSVDPSLLGWAAALLCYPPFNAITSRVLGSPVSDFPQFSDPTVHLSVNLLLLILMAGYSSASVALGFKASNLTHRGIVARGPYALIRHPAYAFKNAAWWIGSLPLVLAAASHSWLDATLAFSSVVGWTMLYVLRALTEEDHLRSVDGEYDAYAARVRYRFIPGLV